MQLKIEVPPIIPPGTAAAAGPKKFAQHLQILLPLPKPDAVESAASGKNG
jgi:hypothetical protein